MTRVLSFRNRQRTRALNGSLLRRLVRHLLECELGFASYELCFHFVEAAEMARVNQQFLQHEGSTDVITFDHSDDILKESVHGEIFISIPDAVKQAKEFGTSSQAELLRYIIHGLLHLRGHDDLRAKQRRLMKREENRLLKIVQARFLAPRLVQTRNPKPKTRNRS